MKPIPFDQHQQIVNGLIAETIIRGFSANQLKSENEHLEGRVKFLECVCKDAIELSDSAIDRSDKETEKLKTKLESEEQIKLGIALDLEVAHGVNSDLERDIRNLKRQVRRLKAMKTVTLPDMKSGVFAHIQTTVSHTT